ncbi:MAG: proline dehydrogenase family protein [Actinobacteria bacterium]|nr:proline dehydrogenase family protein [Actinomycetota bacterium]
MKRVVAGESVDDALAVASELADRGFCLSLERAAPTVTSDEVAAAVTGDYAALIEAVASAGLGGVCEVSVFPESLGVMPDSGEAGARQRLFELTRLATDRSVALMVGMGPAGDVDQTITWVDDLHAAGMPVGVTLPAVLRRTAADCERFAGRRVRLVKGGHRGTAAVAYAHPIEIDKSFVRCAKTLLRGGGEPSFATHDPRARYGRPRHSYEFAFFMGRQEAAQERLLAAGERVRIYVPYGPDWFERLVGGLAEQPSSISAALRSLLPGSS